MISSWSLFKMQDQRCGCESSDDIYAYYTPSNHQLVTYNGCHTEYLFNGRLDSPSGSWYAVVCRAEYLEYRAIWRNGLLVRYLFYREKAAMINRHHPTKPAMMHRSGSHLWYWAGEKVTEERHIQIRQRLIRQMRWLKMRRFLRLCKSREFVETFYAPTGLGGQWAKQQLKKTFFITDE